MITALLRPLTAIWHAMVRFHRSHLADDPDVALLREQQCRAEQANRRLNQVEQRYLGRSRRP